MACSQYTLLNTGSTVINFNYQRCDNALWEYQVELLPGQVKNIWLLNGTYSSAFSNINLTNNGVFPPVGPTPTPSVTSTITPTITPTPSTTTTTTPTPTVTPTTTVTPTVTSTVTPTPTVTSTTTATPTVTPTITVTPTNARFSFSVSSGSTAYDACHGGSSVTIWGDNPIFDDNDFFYNSATGPVTINMAGFYSNGVSVCELVSNGTTTPSGVFSACASPTPTPTVTTTTTPTPTVTTTSTVTPTITPTTTITPTITPTETPTPTVTPTITVTPTVTTTTTPTITPSITPTIGYFTYNLGSGSTSNLACADVTLTPVYAPLVGGIGPNVGETLYQTPGTPPTNTVPDGYYSDGTDWWLVSGGSGLITSRGNC